MLLHNALLIRIVRLFAFLIKLLIDVIVFVINLIIFL